MTPEQRREMYGLVMDCVEPVRALAAFCVRHPSAYTGPLSALYVTGTALPKVQKALEEEINAES